MLLCRCYLSGGCGLCWFLNVCYRVCLALACLVVFGVVWGVFVFGRLSSDGVVFFFAVGFLWFDGAGSYIVGRICFAVGGGDVAVFDNRFGVLCFRVGLGLGIVRVLGCVCCVRRRLV